MKRILFTLMAVAALAFTAGTFATSGPVIYAHPDRQAKESRFLAAEREMDVLGNEVATAVAEYSEDEDGEAYERHSPQTELSLLASPKS